MRVPLLALAAVAALVGGRAPAARAQVAGPSATDAWCVADAPARAMGTVAPRAGDPPEIALVLNLPAFRLDVWREGTVVRSVAVAIGAPRYRTPVGDYEITHLVWNPWWHPPDSPWARRERVTPPGPTNPMGKVKLAMAGPYYLHGTPFATSVGSAASHGCVRLADADAIDIARFLQEETGATIDAAALDSLLGDYRRTREVWLPRPVPVRIEYELVELRGDSLVGYPDVYRRARASYGALALQRLGAAGRDTAGLTTTMLDRALRGARRTRTAVALTTLRPPD